MTYEEFCARYLAGSNPMSYQEAAIRAFLSSDQETVCQWGKQGGKSFVRQAVIKYLNDQEVRDRKSY